MKILIVIPCYNEEEGIGLTLLAHTIDDILAFLHLAHHIHDNILIVAAAVCAGGGNPDTCGRAQL